MKTIKRFYLLIMVIGFLLFALFGAYYSTPMLPSVETEFKASVQKDYHKSSPPVSPIKKIFLDI